MEGNNFVLPGTDRVPSVFAASCLFFSAVAGKPIMGSLSPLIKRAMSYFVYNLDDAFFSAMVTGTYYLVFLLLPFLLLALRRPGMGEYIRVHPIRTRFILPLILCAPLGYFLCAYVNYFWCMGIEALGGSVTHTQTPQISSAGDMLALFLSNAMMPAVCEELLFRGALLSAWEEKGSKRAMLISTALFMLLHSAVSGMPVQLMSGFVMAFIVIVTGSLFSGIVYHALHNTLALVLSAVDANAAESVKSSYFDAIGGLKGCLVIGGVSVLLLILLICLLRYMKKISGKPFGRPKLKTRERDAYDYTVIVSGVAAAVSLYAEDVLRLVGAIR